MSESNQLPPAAMIATHEVADWATWKAHFDGHERARKAAGILGHHINRGLDNPNVITVYPAVSDMAHPGLKDAMQKAGVTSAPQVTFVTGGWAKRY